MNPSTHIQIQHAHSINFVIDFVQETEIVIGPHSGARQLEPIHILDSI